jgi:digeranylgeranylglycerophospholipid reductase
MKVVIVGAGPAGLITALKLLEVGLKPLILEKEPEIRSTACGEALGLQWLSELPFDSSPYIAKRVKGAKLIFPGGNFDLIDKECAVLNRNEWLKGMAETVEQRGGKVRLSAEVVAIASNRLKLETGELIAYDTLIGADGPKSSIARHLGMSYDFIVASQYKISHDTSGMDYLEFYFDKRFSFGYAWIFPKEKTINIGLGGDFSHLDAFLQYKGLDKQRKIKKEAGIIPASGISGKLVAGNIALIGDAAAMPNPSGSSGLAPIIQASQILKRNIDHLEDYQREVKNHPMANPILPKGALIMKSFTNQDLANIGKLFAGLKEGAGHAPYLTRVMKHPVLLPRLKKLWTVYKAGKIAMDYGW